MASEIFEETLNLEIGLLEAGPATADSYPYPSLAPVGRSEPRAFRAVILENPYLRATFVPALGGRLLSLFDKRSQVEVLHEGPLVPMPGGRRGASLPSGICLHLDGADRLTSMASVQYAAEEPDEETPAALWLAEAVTGTGLSWHLHVVLPPDRAELRIEARVFNRTWEDVPYRAGLLLPVFGENRSDGTAFFTLQDGRGVGLIPERGGWSAGVAGGALVLARFPEMRGLAPRQLDTWAVSIIPVSGLGHIDAISRYGALAIEGDRLRLQAVEPLRMHKIILLTRSGQTMEAPLLAFPEEIVEMSLPEPVDGVALLDAHKDELLRWEGEWLEIGRETPPAAPCLRPSLRSEDLEDATFDVATRHAAHALLGNRALAAGDLAEAEYRYEQALLYNAEDHLTWWMKAIAKREGGHEGGEVAEMLNAHYLAPLDPILRAESFFRQPRPAGKEPAVLLRPMDEHPENYVEVAALLVEAQLFELAGRWIDEALRHLDLPMLRYLLAYAHIKATGMDFEAAEQVAVAGRMPLAPPFPWRQTEIEAIFRLAERFPGDGRLHELTLLLLDFRALAESK
ncbi:MAG TPA: DUF5107 domain-containing protein [Fimbriimonadaceae bacterium]|nr:DUF5107 domain-containing protein [Fimbriimonadaceae bacterium]